jgi:hypothetical protein
LRVFGTDSLTHGEPESHGLTEPEPDSESKSISYGQSVAESVAESITNSIPKPYTDSHTDSDRNGNFGAHGHAFGNPNPWRATCALLDPRIWRSASIRGPMRDMGKCASDG